MATKVLQKLGDISSSYIHEQCMNGKMSLSC